MLAALAASVPVSPPVSFYLIASVLFPCRAYVGLMSWLLCLCRCCSLSGVPAFRCLIAFSFFRLRFGSEVCELFVFEYPFFNVAPSVFGFAALAAGLLSCHSVFTMSYCRVASFVISSVRVPSDFIWIFTFFSPDLLLWGL